MRRLSAAPRRREESLAPTRQIGSAARKLVYLGACSSPLFPLVARSARNVISPAPESHFDTFRNTTPCLGTSAVYEFCTVPRSLRSHKSRRFADDGAPMALKSSVIFSVDSPRLNSPAACEPSASGFTQISSGPSSHTRWPCTPLASWSTAITSGFIRMALVSSDMLRMSFPASSGAARMAHSAMCVKYSSCFIPPFPTSNMSGSFQWPGPANFPSPSCEKPIRDMLLYLSLMSPVVRQRFPVCGPQVHGAFTPQLQMLKTIGRPDCAMASRNLGYCTSGSSPSE